MIKRLDEYRPRNEQTCPDCGRWTSRANADGLCPACDDHPRNAMHKVYTLASAARGDYDDLDPLDGGPDDPYPAA